MKITSIVLSVLLVAILAGCQSPVTIAPASIGTISAHTQTIRRIADENKKTSASPADATAFGEISAEANALDVGVKALTDLVTSLQSKLKSALDIAKLRDSFIPLGWSCLAAGVLCVAAWGYFKTKVISIDWLRYLGFGLIVISISSVAMYLAIDTIQTAMPWILFGIGVLVAAASAYWFVKHRNDTAAQLQAGAIAKITNAPAVVMDKIQTPATKKLAASVKAKADQLLKDATGIMAA